jgi:hypothetical protein
MLTNREQQSFYSDGERSEVASQFDKDEKDDIFRVLNASKSQGKLDGINKEEEKVENHSESEWQNGIPISPMSNTSRPERIR